MHDVMRGYCSKASAIPLVLILMILWRKNDLNDFQQYLIRLYFYIYTCFTKNKFLVIDDDYIIWMY